MMHRRTILMLASLVSAGAAAAQAEGAWLRLGAGTLDPRGEHAQIVLRRARVDSLVLGVDNAAVRILDVKVVLANGSVIDWPTRGILYPGQRTQLFDLPGRFDRRVLRVGIRYETGLRRGRAERFEPDRDREWERDWHRDWSRDYGRFRPTVTIWGRD
jgi:hypothetical protein